MFNSSNPFPSSIHGFPPPSASFFGHENDDVYFTHHPFLVGDCSFHDGNVIAPPPPPAGNIKASGSQYCEDNNNNNNNNNNDNHQLQDSVISTSRKRVAASKKDRHSKIFTAQGPRDRRVRLSIEISRKFFGLQDLLGFDKASKTLDWLFTKSMTAIKDLVQEMKHGSSSSLSDRCEVVFMEDEERKNRGLKKKKPLAKCVNGGKRKKKMTQKHKTGFHVNLATRNQLRAEARARARERTIEKLQIKKLHHDSKNVVLDHNNYCYDLQSRTTNLFYTSQQNFVDSKDSSCLIKHSHSPKFIQDQQGDHNPLI
uniref:Cycloidea-like 7 n=2 Tax=Gerbera hybrida TaxID=18101 RepID=G9FR52_GERHY|nr:cycloidea-like 7 [Gerbera hybrid cultivar]